MLRGNLVHKEKLGQLGEGFSNVFCGGKTDRKEKTPTNPCQMKTRNAEKISTSEAEILTQKRNFGWGFLIKTNVNPPPIQELDFWGIGCAGEELRATLLLQLPETSVDGFWMGQGGTNWKGLFLKVPIVILICWFL